MNVGGDAVERAVFSGGLAGVHAERRQAVCKCFHQKMSELASLESVLIIVYRLKEKLNMFYKGYFDSRKEFVA